MGAGAAECIGEGGGGGGTRGSSGGSGGGLRSEGFGYWVGGFAVEEFGDCYLYLGVGNVLVRICIWGKSKARAKPGHSTGSAVVRG